MSRIQWPWCAVVLAASVVARAVEWQSQPGFRVAPLARPVGSGAGFTLLPPSALGIDFTNALAPDRVQRFQNLMNGSGVAAADIDGDGLTDLYFCHKQSANQLYRNLGNGRFGNITAQAGAACTNQTSTGAVFADVNGDGAPDLLVSSFGGPHSALFNDGRGRFTNATASAGITGKSGSTSLALGDLDGDGDLDLYWCNFGVQAILRDGGVVSTRMVNGQPQVTGRYANRLRLVNGMLYEFGEPDSLFINDGTGRFTAAPWETHFTDESGKPMAPPWDFGLAVQIRDANGDGHPDIYVCNDFQTPDRLWLGDGRGHFRAAGPFALRNMSYASMGVDFADIDRDGRMDFVTVEMLSADLPQHLRTASPMQPLERIPGRFEDREDFPRNCLYWNRGDGTWAEIAFFAGVAATGWSWTPLFLDVDLDGWEDLLVSNGHLHDVNNRDVSDQNEARAGQSLKATKDILGRFPPLEPPKFAFRNRGDLTFENMSRAWGFDASRMAHGMISVDLDGDGDLDVAANALEGPPLIWRNNATAPRVAVRLRGAGANTAGIGAILTLRGGPVVQTQEMICGGQYLSHSDTLRVFAAGTGPLELEVRWRSGRTSKIADVKAGFLYEVLESDAGTATPPPTLKSTAPWFADVSASLNHTHVEPAFDDFGQQPLLPQRYGQLGPAVAWMDLNRDGAEDLVIGSGRSGQPGVFVGNGKGGFSPFPVHGPVAHDDLAGLALIPGGTNGAGRLVAAMASYENGRDATGTLQVWDIQDDGLQSAASVPMGNVSSGAMALADFDQDGSLDVFVAGRLKAGRWPEPVSSQWLRNVGGNLSPAPEASAPFRAVGLVSDAVAADLDGDGRTDLALACELGPLRLFQNLGGTFREWTPSVQMPDGRRTDLKSWVGGWTSVQAVDLDGDGRLDLVVGNLGRNTRWQAWGEPQAAMFWADLGEGTVSVVEALRSGDVFRPVRDRQTLARGIADLPARVTSAAQMSGMDARSMFPGDAKVGQATMTTLASIALLHRGDVWEWIELPREAQWAPVFGIAPGDFDGDGVMDVFLAQNLFAVRPDDSRLDSGHGLLLRGDGKGRLEPVPSAQSGIAIYGEGRGAAAADFDRDGRLDLAVAQNGAATRLFRNLSGTPGLRVELAGPAGNPRGIGAVVRSTVAGKSGPAQAVSSGGGYGSTGSATTLWHGPRPQTITVRWPNGTETRAAVPNGAADMRIDMPNR
jgi:enediyne biosynthesis protein E4